MESSKIRLNRYLARAGICSRRKADELIARGEVEVNGKVVTQMGYQVEPGDKVSWTGTPITLEKNIYILLNKPSGVVTTTSDPKGRITVMDFIKEIKSPGLFPVGRLDKETTGLLLITNDGELAEKLAHPRYEVKKIYRVYLDKPLSEEHREKIARGIKLEDGMAKVEDIQYLWQKKNKKKVQVTLHIGRKRVVRRIFEALGYRVIQLDRIRIGELDKKGLQQGAWRYLASKEVAALKKITEEER